MFERYSQFREYAEKNAVKMVDFKEIDLAGRWHHLSIPVERFTEELLRKGIGFDGSSYGFTSVEKSDMAFIPDMTSAFLDPIAEIPTLTMIGDIYKVGEKFERFESDPRHIADKAEAYLRSSGVADTCLFGPEFEFYVLDNVEYRIDTHTVAAHLDSVQAEWNSYASNLDEPGRNQGYKVAWHKGYHADIPNDSSFDLRNAMVRILEDNGVPVKYHHPENGGPGQVEIEVNFAALREMGDRTQKLKYIVKNVARREGRTVTFMPKPYNGESGCGMHVHIQMFKNGAPVFYDAKGYSCLSQTALYAIGGILRHSPALLGFTNPSTNSYKRLVPGFEAPVTICFATANRSSVIRIPGYAIHPEDKRFEFRPADATANPYLCYTAILMAAVDGVLNKIDPVAEHFGPYDKNMYYLTDEEKKYIKSLPKSLEEAADSLERDNDFLTAGDVFPKSLIQDQLKKIRADAEEVNRIPHPAEFKKYFDI